MQVKHEQFLEIKDQSDLTLLRQALDKDPLPAYDLETDSLSWVRGRPFMQQVWAAGQGFWVDRRRAPDSLWFDVARFTLKVKALLGHNLKFELLFSRKEWNLVFEGRVHDTLIQSFLLDENTSHRLKDLSEKRWGPTANALEQQILDWFTQHNGGKKQYDLLPVELCSWYGVQDVFLTKHLDQVQRPLVEKDFRELYQTECDLVKVLVDMESQGMRLDMPYLKSLGDSLQQEMKLLEPQVYSLAGTEFNVGSDVQLADVLYRKLELKPKVYTEKGQPSTNKEALGTLEHPIGQLLLQYRDLETSYHTFIVPWLDFADSNGYLHPSFNQTGTRSGRFSSSDPNAQQIPKRSQSAKRLRQAFIYPEGQVGGSGDQCQMEMVGFAHYSADPTMRKALIDGQDLHRVTAVEAKIAESYETCTSDQRKLGKGSNFAIVYGCGSAKLGSFLSQDMYAGRFVSNEEAQGIMQRYKQRFNGIGAFTQRVIQTVRYRPEHYVQNMFGRRCRLAPDKAYVGVNRLIQSWAADAMKRSMVLSWQYAQRTGGDLKLYVNIHDDLKWFSPPKSWWEHARVLEQLLGDCPGLTVPIRVETTRSETSWADEEVVHLDKRKDAVLS